MPPLDLSINVFGRPLKPVSLVFAATMLLVGIVSILDIGVLKDSLWSDVIGAIAFGVFGIFSVSWWFRSQIIGEVALLGAFFVWGCKFWIILLMYGDSSFRKESFWLSLLWSLLAAGSWLLERADPGGSYASRGDRWTRR